MFTQQLLRDGDYEDWTDLSVSNFVLSPSGVFCHTFECPLGEVFYSGFRWVTYEDLRDSSITKGRPGPRNS